MKDISYIAAVIDTFLVMNGLGVLAALLVFAAMLMYLQTRQRSEIVSYGLSLRMGMRSSRHLAAIAIEVGAMLADRVRRGHRAGDRRGPAHGAAA